MDTKNIRHDAITALKANSAWKNLYLIGLIQVAVALVFKFLSGFLPFSGVASWIINSLLLATLEWVALDAIRGIQKPLKETADKISKKFSLIIIIALRKFLRIFGIAFGITIALVIVITILAFANPKTLFIAPILIFSVIGLGIYLRIRWGFTNLLIKDYGINSGEALKASFNATKGKVMKYIGSLIPIALIHVLIFVLLFGGVAAALYKPITEVVKNVNSSEEYKEYYADKKSDKSFIKRIESREKFKEQVNEELISTIGKYTDLMFFVITLIFSLINMVFYVIYTAVFASFYNKLDFSKQAII